MHQQDDFVAAIPGSVGRIALAQATRAWRGAMRTIIAINNTILTKELSKCCGHVNTHGLMGCGWLCHLLLLDCEAHGLWAH